MSEEPNLQRSISAIVSAMTPAERAIMRDLPGMLQTLNSVLETWNGDPDWDSATLRAHKLRRSKVRTAWPELAWALDAAVKADTS